MLDAVASRATGAAMDRPIPRRRINYFAVALGALALVAIIVMLVRLMPHGLRIAANDIRVAVVEKGAFHNDILVRATAAPLHTIILDALEAGRVEEVLVNDGAQVKRGELLYRLSNPQLRLNLVAREADRAQQIANLANLRVALESARTEHERRRLDLKYSLAQVERQQARFVVLAHDGVIPVATLEDSQDRLAQQRQAADDEDTRAEVEVRIKREGIKEMEQAVQQLDAGLKVVNESIEALAVRAPIAGRLTDFHLQLGEIVQANQHIGRIDAPSEFKLMAQIDEYYLGSISVGKTGSVTTNGRDYAVQVSRVFPQIDAGRFSIELLFTQGSPPELSPGQSAETRITLGATHPGLILPNDEFLNDTSGAWVFVLTRDGRAAERRNVHLGRRNNSQVEVLSGVAAGEGVIVSGYAPYAHAERLQLTR